MLPARTQPAPDRIFRFGPYELSPYLGELRRGGLRVRLQEQPLRVLTLLLEHPGQLVTREELQRQLWSTDTFVDFDVGLNTAVLKLRRALRDNADRPRYVETLARRGYRFVAPVSTVEAQPEPSPSPVQPVFQPVATQPIRPLADPEEEREEEIDWSFWVSPESIETAAAAGSPEATRSPLGPTTGSAIVHWWRARLWPLLTVCAVLLLIILFTVWRFWLGQAAVPHH